MADRFPWFPLAAKALKASIAEDYTTAATAIEELARTFGSEAVPQVLLALIDTMLGHTVVPASPDALAFLETESGAIQGADEVPPAVLIPVGLAIAGVVEIARHFSDGGGR